MEIPSVVIPSFSIFNTPDYPYCCEICKLSFANQTFFLLHKRLSTEVSEVCDPHFFEFKCNNCSKYFTTFQGLKQHEGKIHDKIKKIKCKQCSKKFKSSYLATTHRRQVHSKKNRTQCYLCGQLVYNKYSLKKHLKLCKENLFSNNGGVFSVVDKD